jgi:nucleotide-binding universal stress UspA family protein
MKALIAFDGSAEAERAVEWVERSGSFSEATVLGVGPTQAVRRARRRRGRAYSERPGWASPDELWEAVGRLAGAGMTARPVERTGNVVKSIVDEAAKGGYDAVVVGSRARHGVWRMLFASKAEKIVRQAPVDVIVVR